MRRESLSILEVQTHKTMQTVHFQTIRRNLNSSQKLLNHSVSVGSNLSAWCFLLLQTDFEVAPPKPLAIKNFASTDRTFRDEEIFFFMADRYFSATEYLNSGANPPILVRREWDHRLREHVKT